MTARPTLVAIAGPTGSGKSSLAIYLAQQLDGEVINCDSLQIFKYFDIGTAKLPEAEWQGIPHHLISWAPPDQTITAGAYSRLARELAQQIAGRGKVPIVAGGTGFYLRAMLGGLSPAPERDTALRTKLAHREQRHPGLLHRLLRRKDFSSSVRIHAHDIPKLIRALEIAFRGETTASAQPAPQPLEGFQICKVGLFPPRAELYQGLDQRCEAMFAMGLIDECRSILARGYSPDAKPFEAIGYAQAAAALAGKLTREEALASTKLQTRRYAKRQVTWFRREPDLYCLEGFGTDRAIQQRASEWLQSQR